VTELGTQSCGRIPLEEPHVLTSNQEDASRVGRINPELGLALAVSRVDRQFGHGNLGISSPEATPRMTRLFDKPNRDYVYKQTFVEKL